MATNPTGRILQPDNPAQYSPITVKIQDGWASLNMPISIPHQAYLESLPVKNGMPPKLANKVSLGDLVLKSSNG